MEMNNITKNIECELSEISNELEKFMHILSSKVNRNEVLDVREKLLNHELLEEMPEFLRSLSSSLMLRDIMKGLAGCVLPTQKWVTPLAKWLEGKKCLEIMSGCGSLAKALQDKGIDVTPTDNFKEHTYDSWATNLWTPIENIDCLDAISKYKDVDIIIMSWPYVNDTCVKVLRKMREVNPKAQLLYIGEGYDGCTACDEFFDELVEITDDKEFNAVAEKYETYYGDRDKLWLVR